MAVLKKSPGAPLVAKKANDGYHLYQGFAGLGATHVMAAPVRHAGFPGIWTAQEIGPEGHYGREHFIYRDLAQPIGGGDPHKFNRYLTLPIDKPLSGVESNSMGTLPWLARVAVGFAGAALLMAVLGKKMTANSPILRQSVDDNFWLIYWRQPGTATEDATFIGSVIDQGHGGYTFFAEAASGATGTHESLEDAEKWLVTRTWRVFPGGKG
jgi:hypothetical protein